MSISIAIICTIIAIISSRNYYYFLITCYFVVVFLLLLLLLMLLDVRRGFSRCWVAWALRCRSCGGWFPTVGNDRYLKPTCFAWARFLQAPFLDSLNPQP